MLSFESFQLETYPCLFIGHRSKHKGYRCLHPFTRRVSYDVVSTRSKFSFVHSTDLSTFKAQVEQMLVFPNENERSPIIETMDVS